MLQDSGFNLRKFTTNMPQLQRAIDKLEESSVSPATASSHFLHEMNHAKGTLGGIQKMSPSDQKVLGVSWDVVADCLVFSVQEIAAFADVERPTKRKVTNVVSKVCDPQGFLSSVVITFKMFYKELGEEHLE